MWLYIAHFLIILVQPPSADVPEKIRKWRELQQSRLEDKDAAEEKAKEVLRKQAEKELEDWYKRHEETIAKTKNLNRWEEYLKITISVVFWNNTSYSYAT